MVLRAGTLEWFRQKVETSTGSRVDLRRELHPHEPTTRGAVLCSAGSSVCSGRSSESTNRAGQAHAKVTSPAGPITVASGSPPSVPFTVTVLSGAGSGGLTRVIGVAAQSYLLLASSDRICLTARSTFKSRYTLPSSAEANCGFPCTPDFGSAKAILSLRTHCPGFSR